MGNGQDHCAVRVTTAGLINELTEAADDRVPPRVVRRYGRLDLLCLDEFGYVQIVPKAPNCSSRPSPNEKKKSLVEQLGDADVRLRLPPGPRGRKQLTQIDLCFDPRSCGSS